MAPKQSDLPEMKGPGVEIPRYKDLDRLGDKFIEIRDEKAELATKLGKVEEQIAESMNKYGLTKYRFSDQEVLLKPGKTHVKIKTVKVDSGKSAPMDDPDDEP